MGELHRALGDLSSIRRQMARSTEFRGYGPLTLASTAAMAVAAAELQSMLLPDPAAHLTRYLAIWVSLASLAGTLTCVQMCTRSRRMHSVMSGEMIRMAVEQFLPSLLAGLLVTVVLFHYVAQALWMLPGLWQMIFSLGVFSSCRFLPRLVLLAGAWYLLTGLLCLALGDARALAPWCMGIPFGVGQLLVAAILFISNRETATDV